MKLLQKIALLLSLTLIFGCFEDMDDTINPNVKDFVWRGLNAVYLYKDSQADLADDRFNSNQEYSNFLNNYNNPEELFYNLVVNQDRFSFLVDDYIALEQLLSGTTVSNGMEFSLYYKPGSNTQVYGIVEYVLPNTSASNNGINRGDVFDAVNGIPLTNSNYTIVYNNNSYSITLGTYDNNGTPTNFDDDSVISGTETITLSKTPYTENPIFLTEIIPVNGNNVGYLMYNGFTANFDSQLNQAFATFQNAGITDLVLDLRYNSGGSVNSAVLLSSLITGQFNDQVFLTRQWNSQIQNELEANNPELLINRFTNQFNSGTAINSLQLNQIYILTTESTASASELVINCLKPYINVVQIGDYTTGKYQASTTLYDSPDFGRSGANPTHTYALQPLIFKSLNADGVTDYDSGLEPNILVLEDFSNMGILGNENEPLLAAAIAEIEGTGRTVSNQFSKWNTPKKIGNSKDKSPIKNRMYIDTYELPLVK